MILWRSVSLRPSLWTRGSAPLPVTYWAFVREHSAVLTQCESVCLPACRPESRAPGLPSDWMWSWSGISSSSVNSTCGEKKKHTQSHNESRLCFHVRIRSRITWQPDIKLLCKVLFKESFCKHMRRTSSALVSFCWPTAGFSFVYPECLWFARSLCSWPLTFDHQHLISSSLIQSKSVFVPSLRKFCPAAPEILKEATQIYFPLILVTEVTYAADLMRYIIKWTV